jgi:hypothetical protein
MDALFRGFGKNGATALKWSKQWPISMLLAISASPVWSKPKAVNSPPGAAARPPGKNDFTQRPLRGGQPADTSKLNTSPGVHSAVTSNGRQQTSQSVVNRWLATLVSMATSDG